MSSMVSSIRCFFFFLCVRLLVIFSLAQNKISSTFWWWGWWILMLLFNACKKRRRQQQQRAFYWCYLHSVAFCIAFGFFEQGNNINNICASNRLLWHLTSFCYCFYPFGWCCCCYRCFCCCYCFVVPTTYYSICMMHSNVRRNHVIWCQCSSCSDFFS